MSKKGGMTGGFYDYKRSRLKLMSIIKQNMKTIINMKEDELNKVKEELQDILKNIVLSPFFSFFVDHLRSDSFTCLVLWSYKKEIQNNIQGRRYRCMICMLQ